MGFFLHGWGNGLRIGFYFFWGGFLELFEFLFMMEWGVGQFYLKEAASALKEVPGQCPIRVRSVG